MTVFNSLGSNYTFRFGLWSLFIRGHGQDQALCTYLEKRYQGTAVLVYKGREAITLALSMINAKDSLVGICGYTCFAVYEAVTTAGYKPYYLDIDDSLHFTYEIFMHAVKRAPGLKILILQNTLGFPVDIEKIETYCRDHEIVLIEDLAHSIGATYEDGREAGTVGDFTALSFSQDKMIDGVSGGALIVRNKRYRDTKPPRAFGAVSDKTRRRDRWYPFLTVLIRNSYSIGIGKVIHVLARRLNLLSIPMGTTAKAMHSLDSWYAVLILEAFQKLPENIRHRRQIAGIYQKLLHPQIQDDAITAKISRSSALRYPVFVTRRDKLIRHLKKHGVYVSDIWYDSPIAPKRYLPLTDYQNQCANAQKISDVMLNLPTHRNVSLTDAARIAQIINGYLKT
jgi:dTDP-4-amino-4,6-dideoxygalactose transaminase